MGLIFNVIGFVSGYIFIFLCFASLACGLYYLALLAEEYTVLTKKIIKWTIIGVEVLHLLCLFEFPFAYVAVGSASHAMYALLLQDFPFIELGSLKLILAVVSAFINHFVWFKFFSHVHFNVIHTMGFLVTMVWVVPFAFFTSTTVNDYVLPSGESEAAVNSPRSVNLLIASTNMVMATWDRFKGAAIPSLGKHR
mmetsp:Transcript_38251/g.51789  ORF Transcript_38251/g.51789 Transcript_38251/m.51789 type:complete len:195 (-) Transcript_38251:535-1119(-)